MKQERDLEPVQSVEEIQGELSDESMVDRSKELFGHSLVPPSFYRCVQCKNDILAQDVVWDRETQPHCPECNSILEPRSDENLKE